MTYPCPQCGHDTPEDDFCEGVCPDCWQENQDALDAWDAGFDWWESLSDRERDKQIKAAIRRAS